MAGRGDQLLAAAVEAALRKGPKDVLELIEALRALALKPFEGHEGTLHPFLHALLRRGTLRLATASERGLVRYALPGGGSGAHAAPEPPDPTSAPAKTAARIAAGVRDPLARARIGADVAAHLSMLEAEGATGAFGSQRAVRQQLRRADTKRRSVFFTDGAPDTLLRLAVHEGPWLLGALVVFLVVRAFVAEVFVIPSGSMIPTLMPGDRVVVFKPGGKDQPERWRIYTFERWDTTFVKRAVGFGGEKIALVGGDLYVDGALAVKPEDVREALRLPYATWDLGGSAPAWARTEPSPGERVWTYAGEVLYSDGPADVSTGGDVRLRDVYAHLDVERAAGETVVLELRYESPRGGTTGEETVFRLTVGDTGARLAQVAADGATELAFQGQEGSPPTGPIGLALSLVDGVVRADGAGVPFRKDGDTVNVRPGLVVTPAFRIAASGGSVTSRPLRFRLEKDLHYTYAGDLAHPDALGDEDPRTYGYQVPPGHVFFLGDNTTNSKDSRYRADRQRLQLGAVPAEDLIGPVAFRIWPPGRIGTVR